MNIYILHIGTNIHTQWFDIDIYSDQQQLNPFMDLLYTKKTTVIIIINARRNYFDSQYFTLDLQIRQIQKLITKTL